MKNNVLALSIGMLIASAFAQWQPAQQLTNDSGATYLTGQQCIAAQGDTLHVIFVDDRTDTGEIYYLRSRDAGATWDSAVRLSLRDSGQHSNAVIAGSGPNVHVVWEAYSSQVLKYRRSTDAGTTWTDDESLVASALGCGGASLSADGNNVGLAWGDGRDGNWNGEMYYKQSSDGGLTWTPDTRLTVGPDTSADTEAWLVLAGNYRYIAWRRYHWHTHILTAWFMRSTDAGTTWEPRSHVTSDTINQSQPTLAANGPDVHLVWFDGRDTAPGLYYRHSSDFGAGWSPEERITSGQTAVDYPGLAVSGRNVHVDWRDVHSGQFDLGYRHSTDNGATWEPDTLLTNDPADDGTPSIAASGERVHVVFYGNATGNWEIYYLQNPTGSGVEDTPNAEVRTTNPVTIVRGVLVLGAVGSRQHTAHRAELLDVSGRKVLDLHPGANDVSGLVPGVYFVRTGSTISRVVCLR